MKKVKKCMVSYVIAGNLAYGIGTKDGIVHINRIDRINRIDPIDWELRELEGVLGQLQGELGQLQG